MTTFPEDLTCPVCKSPAKSTGPSYGPFQIECERCGTYRLTYPALTATSLLKDSHQLYLLSAALRYHSFHKTSVLLEHDNGDELIRSIPIPNDLIDAIDLILWHFADNSNRYSSVITFTPDNDYPIAATHDGEEFKYVIDSAKEEGYLEVGDEMPYAEKRVDCQLTRSGWQRIRDIKDRRIISDQAFVAMSFDSTLNFIYDNAIYLALKSCNFNPYRIDRQHFSGKVDDMIISEIRKSGILIADFTQNKPGVYFEAGFAMGLKIPVIWTCRDTDMNAVHFDTNHFSHIVWNDASDFESKLKARIEALYPRQKKGK